MPYLAARHPSANSKRISLSQDLKKGLDQNLNNEPETPVVDIPEVHLDSLGDLVDRPGGTAQSMNLCPSGHARLDMVTRRVVLQQLLKVVVMGQGVWSGPNQGHLSPNDIEHLR